MALSLMAPIGGGVLSALLYLSVLAGGFGALILAWLAPLPLLLVGLSLGTGACLLAGAVAVLAVGLTGGIVLGLTFAISNVVLVTVLVRQALLARTAPDGSVQWYPPGLLLMVLTGTGIGVMMLGALVLLGEPGGAEGAIRTMLTAMLDQVIDGGSADPASPGSTMIEALASVFPAVLVISWLAMTIVNASLAQGTLMRFHRNRRPPMRVADIDLPGWAPIALAVAGVGAVLLPDTLGFVAFNAALIMTVPFCLAGLAVVHAYVQARQLKAPMLVLFYCFLLLFGWPILFVFGLGVIEQWAGLRRRLARTGPDQEDQ
jgi:uncharacterized protein YybS (DUF2232 family)